MRFIDADALSTIMDGAISDAPIYIQATVQQIIDLQPTIEPTKPQWTSVEDGLPEKKNEYEVRTWILVAMESGCVKEVRYEFYEGEKVFERMGSAVTHWMPLPEPPKGE